MHIIVRCLFLCVASLVWTSVQAKPVEDFYRVREPIASQQPAVRDEALKRAVDVLIVRLTGKPDAVNTAALASVRANPQQWITRYGYEGNHLAVDFDPATVQAALRQAGLSQWGADRPTLLTWWLTNATEGSQLVADGQETANVLKTAAQYRGLPILMPLGDLGEQLAITPEVLQSGSVEPLRAAASRYAADGLLSVYARPVGDSWQADWQLWVGERQGRGQVSANSLPHLADAVMLATQGFMAPFFAGKASSSPPPAATEQIFLELQGATLARFAELDPLLTSGRLVFVEGDRLLYRFDAIARDQLKAQLAKAHLQELASTETDPAPLVTTTPALRYRW